MRIQLADDDLPMRDLIATVLTAYGHSVETYGDGAEVWAAFQRAPAPLMVLDWEMPVVDGLDVCRRVRAHPGGEDVLNAGADDPLSKPVTPSDVAARLRIVERRMEGARARRSAEEELRKARYLAGVGEVSLALPHEIPDSLKTIEAEAQRIADVLKRLRAVNAERSVEYARGQKVVDLGAKKSGLP